MCVCVLRACRAHCSHQELLSRLSENILHVWKNSLRPPGGGGSKMPARRAYHSRACTRLALRRASVLALSICSNTSSMDCARSTSAADMASCMHRCNSCQYKGTRCKHLKSNPMAGFPVAEQQLKQNTSPAMVSCGRTLHIVMKRSKPLTLAWSAAAAEMVHSLARLLSQAHMAKE